MSYDEIVNTQIFNYDKIITCKGAKSIRDVSFCIRNVASGRNLFWFSGKPTKEEFRGEF
jgi:hypothetical protein